MPGGKGPKRKGDEGEREFKRLMGGERTFWQPENSKDKSHGDLINVPYIGRGEIKRRKGGWLQIYHWIENNDFLGIRADRKEWLVVMRAEDLKLILQEIDELKKNQNQFTLRA